VYYLDLREQIRDWRMGVNKSSRRTVWVLTLLCLVFCASAWAQQAAPSARLSAAPAAVERVRLAALSPASSAVGPAQAAGEESRVATREKLRKVLDDFGPVIHVEFRQSQRQPFNFVGVMTQGISNSEGLEIVIGVTARETIGFRIYPHFKGGYINVDKVKDSNALMRQLLQLSDQAFMFWGMDSTGDVFAGYTITLESGFPEAAIRVVLNSIHNLDKFVGDMRPSIDGTTATAPPPPPH